MVHQSRFEVDLNRSPEAAVYPVEVWGLRVWQEDGPPAAVAERSRLRHDEFYARIRAVLERLERRHGGALTNRELAVL